MTGMLMAGLSLLLKGLSKVVLVVLRGPSPICLALHSFSSSQCHTKQDASASFCDTLEDSSRLRHLFVLKRRDSHRVLYEECLGLKKFQCLPTMV